MFGFARMKDSFSSNTAIGCMAAMQRLWSVLDTKAPLIMMSSRLQAKKAPTMNSLTLGRGLPVAAEYTVPTMTRIAQMELGTSSNPNARLNETIESGSMALRT